MVLYGAPANGNEIQGKAFVKNIDSFDLLPGFKIGSDKEAAKKPKLVDSIEKELDQQGQANIKVKIDEVKTPVDVYLSLSLLDAGGRPITRTVKQSVWPYVNLPAIKPLFNSENHYDYEFDGYQSAPTINLGQPAQFEVAFINNQGKKLAKNGLRAQFVYEKSNYYWVWDEEKGLENKKNSKDLILSQSIVNTSSKGSSQVSFTPREWGKYHLDIIDLDTKATSSVNFYAGYSWNDSDPSSLRPDQVKLSLDKTSYHSGDTAKVQINSPSVGEGYLMVESNDGVLWQKNIKVPAKGIVIDVPIKDWKRNDLYLTTTIIRGQDTSQLRTIKRAVGILHLPIDYNDRKVNFSIQAPAKALPDEPITIKLKLAGNSQSINTKKPITALVSVVDVGILNITNFQTPDPFNYFLGPKSLNIDVYDLYGKIIESSAKKTAKLKYGGDQDEFDLSLGGKKPDSEVKILAQQLVPIRFNAQGEAQVEVTIPDFNGQARVMAQVWNDEVYGHADQTMLISSPIVLELVKPRFLATGDLSTSTLEVRNLTDIPQSINISLKTEGLVSFSEDG
ncbi:hypothetical protein GKC56_00405 [Neisseriaceae bacterium PsAf]|nr:hypothetical protein [Neisseriaceae bacterium PsAf]